MSKNIKVNTEVLHEMGLKEHTDSFGRSTFRPQGKTANAAPEIIEEYYEESVDQESGVSSFRRMYKCEPYDGQTEARVFVADKYDETFVPAHNKKRILKPITGNRATYKGKGR